MSRTLCVYLKGTFAGKLIQEDSGRLSFSYDWVYLTSEKPAALSISMPLSDKVYDERITRPFFSNLLPDDFARHRIARLLGVSEKNPFALLEIMGGECAGAVSLYPEDQIPLAQKSKEYEFLEEDARFCRICEARI